MASLASLYVLSFVPSSHSLVYSFAWLAGWLTGVELFVRMCIHIYICDDWIDGSKKEKERNVNGKTLCIMCWGWFLLFHCPPHVSMYVKHKFSNPLFSANSALLLLLLVHTFMSTLTYHPFCFLFSCARRLCWWVGEATVSLSIFSFNSVWVFFPFYPHRACRKYNQFHFVRALSLRPRLLSLPTFHSPNASLKYPSPFDPTENCKAGKSSWNFSIFWHFPKNVNFLLRYFLWMVRRNEN